VKSKIAQNMRVIDSTNRYIKQQKQMRIEPDIDYNKIVEGVIYRRPEEVEAAEQSWKAAFKNKSTSPKVSNRLNKS
jgi:hypothetical protein